ncbi:MAG: nucleotidyltransferase family protein [Oscillospiraceae bacterium]|nr:nucleotidyltransferase family protein [Oscillospiraceae bacterium]
MRTAAIICEYNPFHYGHKYLIDKTREAGATHIAAVMSGNFTQRGDVAVFDKYVRAKTALENGIDLVIELPSMYSLSAAEGFAAGAVRIIESLGCVDILSFGSESGELAALKEASGACEYALHTDKFFTLMKGGKSYPAALAEVVRELYTDDVSEILQSPNNTLAIEYLNALDGIGSTIEPFTIAREGAAHDSTEAGRFASASLIRKMILSGEDHSRYAPAVDAPSADIKRLERAILARLRAMHRGDLEQLYDGANGLAERLYKAVRKAGTLDELYFLTKTKRYTLARIRRAVLCGFLGLNKGQLLTPNAYIRVLGMNTRGREILSAAKCALPIDTSLKALSKTSRAAHKQAAFEERCGDLYSLAFEKPAPCGRELTAKPIIM